MTDFWTRWEWIIMQILEASHFQAMKLLLAEAEHVSCHEN